MKPLVIYHNNCADGFGAAFAAWKAMGEKAEYLPRNYDSDFAIPKEWFGREIYILDFSFPRATMEWLLVDSKRVVWLDHHRTAFEMWCPGEYNHWIPDPTTEARHHIELNNNKSGALLAWEYFHPNTEVPMLIRHIDDSDRWQFKIAGTKEFIKALWSHAPWSFEQWEKQFLPAEMGKENATFDQTALYSTLRDAGAAILRAHEQNVQSVVRGAARACHITWYDYTSYGLAANCPPHLTSDVGHELATRFGTFGLMWYIDRNNRCKCSLRSNGDYDVSAIAKTFGGGGHKNAAGFEVDIHTLLAWLK